MSSLWRSKPEPLKSPAQNKEYWERVSNALNGKLNEDINQSTKGNYAADVFNAICLYRDEYKRNGSNYENLYKAIRSYRPCSGYTHLLSNLIQNCLALKDQKHLDYITLLHAESNKPVKVSDKDCLILLANAFFCTFRDRDTSNDFKSYPSFNFSRLFTEEQPGSPAEDVKVEKLNCILSYFDSMINNSTRVTRSVEFERVRNSNKINWASNTSPLIPFEFSKSPIEDSKCDLHVDFANKKVGGGVLGNGSVQEEILFISCPELIVASLLTEELDENEVLFVSNFRTFSKFSGYSKSFKFTGPENDTSSNKTIVAMDAIQFKSYQENDQFKPENINRELHKCQIAFQKPSHKTIATGNWGCGAFGGDPQLKSVMQWMAASTHKKKLVFHMMDSTVRDGLEKLAHVVKQENITIGKLYKSILKYSPYLGNKNLLQYLQRDLSSNNQQPNSTKPTSRRPSLRQHTSTPTPTAHSRPGSSSDFKPKQNHSHQYHLPYSSKIPSQSNSRERQSESDKDSSGLAKAFKIPLDGLADSATYLAGKGREFVKEKKKEFEDLISSKQTSTPPYKPRNDSSGVKDALSYTT